MAGGQDGRVHQVRLLALLLAVGALVLPLSGAAGYVDVFASNRFLLVGAANASDILAPMMLAGALALSILVRPGSPSRGARATVVITAIAAAVLAVSFLGSAWVLNGAEFDVGPATGRLTVMAGLVLQSILCLAIAGFAGRLANEQRQVRTS